MESLRRSSDNADAQLSAAENLREDATICNGTSFEMQQGRELKQVLL
jgi:hypothetical protein